MKGFRQPAAVAVQFRYAFVADRDGLAVVDVTDPAAPRLAGRAGGFAGRSVYVARTWAYVAAGDKGIALVDVERPEAPRLDRLWNADGRLKDTRDVKVGSTNASLFAYVADGGNGLAVVQLTSPETVPGYLGFSPRPEPRLIATRRTRGPAVALSRGLDRDRAADESGNQVSVFNRLGARPFNNEEMRRLYLRSGRLYTVTDDPPQPRGDGHERRTILASCLRAWPRLGGCPGRSAAGARSASRGTSGADGRAVRRARLLRLQ